MGDPIADAHLLDVLLACKNEISKKLQPYKRDMEKENGCIIISSLANNEGIKIHYYCLSEILNSNIKSVIENFDVYKVIKKLGTENEN